MKSYLLDTSALLTLRDDEQGAVVVADLLKRNRPNSDVLDSILQV